MNARLRYVVFAVLVAVPPLLAAWILRSGGPAVEEGAAAPPAAPAAADPLAALLGAPPAGARVRASVRFYDRNDLFDYINGGAPLYLERGFVRLAAAELADAAGAPFACDVYDMGTHEGAKAIAAQERSPTLASPADWPEAAAGGGVLFFPERRWYVKLTALDGGAAPEAFARALRSRLP